jgi:hypothetical protein
MVRDENFKQVRTDDMGKFSFDLLQDGKYEIDVAATGFQHASYFVFLGNQTSHWKRALRIKLAVGYPQCEGTIEVVQ